MDKGKPDRIGLIKIQTKKTKKMGMTNKGNFNLECGGGDLDVSKFDYDKEINIEVTKFETTLGVCLTIEQVKELIVFLNHQLTRV